MTQEEFDFVNAYSILTEDERYIVMNLIISLLEIRKKGLEN